MTKLILIPNIYIRCDQWNCTEPGAAIGDVRAAGASCRAPLLAACAGIRTESGARGRRVSGMY